MRTVSATQHEWEELAQLDPLWAILTDKKKKFGNWNLQDFFASGQAEIEAAMRLCGFQEGNNGRALATQTPSATLGFPLYELWGQPVMPFTYQCYGIRRGADLVNPTDALPLGVPEELVLYKAREFAYEWAEANKTMVPRAQGPDFRYLIGQVRNLYAEELKKYRRQDREVMDNYCMNVGFAYGTVAGIYNTLAGVASPYAPA